MGDIAFSRSAISVTLTFCCSILYLAAAIPSAAIRADESAAIQSEKPASNSPKIVCLHTEFHPIKDEEVLRIRLVRELGRQALLIAARDELGLRTRDETLDEAFPNSILKAKEDLFVSVRGQYSGEMRFQIWPASKPAALLPTKKDKKFNPRIILNVVENLEPRTRSELRDQLRQLRFDGKVQPPNEKNMPEYAIENQLREMNFVSQFAAVRAAHAAIAEKGQSREWLSVLARGYANLALTTEHHWKSDTEVFAARALLYAQRLLAADDRNPAAHATRAYVLAVVGLHGPALEELTVMEQLRKQQPDAPKSPDWLELVRPYCAFERKTLLELAKQRPSLAQVAQRLSFEQTRAYGDERWMFESARETLETCPEDYSVYAALTGPHASLGVGRTGGFGAPAAMAHFMPRRIQELVALPKEGDGDKPVTVPKNNSKPSGDANDSNSDSDKQDSSDVSDGQYASTTMPTVESLRNATRSGQDTGEPSWSALGELIFEEQFVQAANFLEISLNATESSHTEVVASILPAVKGHRYTKHIEAYSEPHNYYNLIGDMRLIDPRGNMQNVIKAIWAPDSEKKLDRGPDAAWCAIYDRSLTFNGMQEADNAILDMWWDHMTQEIHQRIADSYKTISPHSPQALRYEMQIAGASSDVNVARWEAEAGEDSTVYMSLGKYFARNSRPQDAIRMFERAVELSPSLDGFLDLANVYRNLGQEDKWQPTLERFFQSEPLGLEHAHMHSIIAEDLIGKDKVEEAEPHALAAAEPAPEWGLRLASQVEERLGKWDESEKFISAAATYYPTCSGVDWYFWCRRTGRGHIAMAKKVAESRLDERALDTDINAGINLITYNLLENNPRTASDDLKRLTKLAQNQHVGDENIIRAYVQTAFVSRELKDKPGEDAAIKEIRRLADLIVDQYPTLGATYTTICDVLEYKAPAADALTSLEEKITNEQPLIRVHCKYFLGRAYDLAGNTEVADRFWKDCVTSGPYERYPATLAGKYLCDRNKTSRP
jgi:tetratricopeptide (TPR) repeat protein